MKYLFLLKKNHSLNSHTVTGERLQGTTIAFHISSIFIFLTMVHSPFMMYRNSPARWRLCNWMTNSILRVALWFLVMLWWLTDKVGTILNFLSMTILGWLRLQTESSPVALSDLYSSKIFTGPEKMKTVGKYFDSLHQIRHSSSQPLQEMKCGLLLFSLFMIDIVSDPP